MNFEVRIMKRVLLFTIIISFIGYSKNPNLPNHPNFKNDLQQELVERMNPLNLEFGDDGMMDLNLTQRISDVKLQSLQSEMIVQSDNDITYRLDGYTSVSFNENDLTSKTESTYDENGSQTIRIYYTWDTNTQSFIPKNKIEYTYDENGNPTIRIYYTRDTTTQSFVPYNKHEYTYDENGNETLKIYYTWDTTTQSFVPNSKSEQNYDENGNRTLYIGYTWDTNTLSFVPTTKYEYTYDENGNNTLYIISSLDTTTQSFVPVKKDVGTYDYTFHPHYKTQRKTEKYYNGIGYKPSFVQDYSIHSETDTELVVLGITKQYDTNSNTWSELQGEEFKSYWYYTKSPSLSTNSLESNLFSIYPNPTSNTLKINSSEYLKTPIFEIYDVKGSKVLSNRFKPTEHIDVSDLQPSMYIYYVKDGSEIKQSGKVLIE